ncbi:hypothetical protein CAPI_08455 [Corynebacterium capitovis DSM 44611]|uniref:hypothetical protein n=1 Tax=Corynebacterium capitovis TaxID=131081 RepID=UPI0003662677|nr:hypothetical protein [Corynebacterium capitovis]WKD58218.1 hypothetical protein CAPI_08455 [Corynebacterium capitovis DSM 44611]
MRLIHCACGSPTRIDATATVPLPAIPGRGDLRFLDEIAAELLPEDDTPSLAEIQASPSVDHLGEPRLAPQRPRERLRVVVSGSDAALGAVLSRMMRRDYLWAEVAYVPEDPASAAATVWGLAGLSRSDLLAAALEAPVAPSPCIRSDRGEVVAGSATITHAVGTEEFVGEIVVDSSVLLYRDGSRKSARFHGAFGARLVPTNTAPGIAAVRLVTPALAEGQPGRLSPRRLEALRRLPGGEFLRRRASVPGGVGDPASMVSGRAVQTGGRNIAVTVDGVSRKHPVDTATFYRHLRDLQSVKLLD